MAEPIRGRWIWDTSKNDLVSADEFVRPQTKRSSLSAPSVMRDSMEPVQSMLDGKMYDSPSMLRKTYKRAGVEEVGNDPQRHRLFKRKPVDRSKVVQSIEKATARVERGDYTEQTKRKHV